MCIRDSLLTPDNVEYWVEVCEKNTIKQLLALLKSNATANPVKAASIDEALAEPPKEVPVEAVVTPIEAVENPHVAQAIAEAAKAAADYIDNEIVESIQSEPVAPSDAPKAQIEVLEEAPPEITVVASVEAPAMTVDQIAEKLKKYKLNTIVSMVTEIYPHIKIEVTEKNDATIND